jgi:hypothetical protein
MSDIELVLDHLINDVLTTRERPQGCSGHEIEEIMTDQKVDRLPQAYTCFLKRIGRGAGELLIGTDAFYPRLIGVKDAAIELITEDGAPIQLPPDSLVIGMHQGYQFFWLPTVAQDDPKVLMFQEGDRTPHREWGTFSSYLNDMIKEIER